MWRGEVPSQRNPMSLVDIRGASKPTKKPRSLTIEQAQKFLSNLPQPFHEIALLCLLLGLRISECLALQWADVDWLQLRLSIDRSVVNQTVEDVKTVESRRNMPLDSSLIDVLKAWKRPPSFQLRATGCSLRLLNSGGCLGRTTRSCAFTRRPLSPQESAHSVRTRSGTRADLCWTAWERLLPSSRSSCVTPISGRP